MPSFRVASTFDDVCFHSISHLEHLGVCDRHEHKRGEVAWKCQVELVKKIKEERRKSRHDIDVIKRDKDEFKTKVDTLKNDLTTAEGNARTLRKKLGEAKVALRARSIEVEELKSELTRATAKAKQGRLRWLFGV